MTLLERISRFALLPLAVWSRTGFSFAAFCYLARQKSLFLDRPLSLNGSVASMSNVDLQNVKHDIAAALVMCQNDH